MKSRLKEIIKMKKFVTITLMMCLLLILTACKEKEKKISSLSQYQTTSDNTTMADVAEEIDYSYDPSSYYDERTQTTSPNQTTQPRVTPPTTGTSNTTQTTKPSTATARQPEAGEYTVQLMSLKDRSRIDDVRRNLNARSYFTEVSEVKVNGETFYRLRLAGSFSRSYATYLAEKIKSEIPDITEYWVTKR